MATYRIKSATVRNCKKNLILENKHGDQSMLAVHRFAMIGPGDTVDISGTPLDPILNLLGASDQEVTISPHFQNYYNIRLGGEVYKVCLSEISTQVDYDNYVRLERYHYKGTQLDVDVESNERLTKKISAGGRRAIILATISQGGLSRAIGYIEIQMPLMMCKPRHLIFARPFRHPERPVHWEKWLGDGQKHVNKIARIARVVVDPEFRGVGISTVLIEAAVDFSKSRWHIGGEKPLFLEISAEMLRYIDFVSSSGFHFIGNTEGNLSRIAQDLDSIEKGASGKSGIMSLQRKYHSAFTAYCKKTGRTFDEARLVLKELLATSDPRSEMASDEWLAFRPMLRFPIPYYMIGLDEFSEEYIKTAKNDALKLSDVCDSLKTKSEQGIEGNIELTGIEVSHDYEIPLTPYVRMVMDSFGLETQTIKSKLIRPMSLTLQAGGVTLITGASGAGKSVLLQALSRENAMGGLRVNITTNQPKIKSGMLSALPEGVPIFQYFSENYSPEKAFNALCQVGLSEALIFVKPFEALSIGQRYRAMLADLILSDAKLWLIDEFCSNLDPISSKIISARLRRLAIKNNCFVVVAAANSEHFLSALQPEEIVLVRAGGSILKMKQKEFQNGFYNKGF